MNKTLALLIALIAAYVMSDDGQNRIYRAKAEISYAAYVLSPSNMAHIVDYRGR